jgi:hypothetical protein
MNKLSFKDWIIQKEDCSEEWLTSFLSFLPNPDKLSAKHCGDCTDMVHTCYLCVIEKWLKGYREYFFSEEAK